VALWDLRYALRLNCVHVPGAGRIHAMAHATPPPASGAYGAAGSRPVLFLGGSSGVVSGWALGEAIPKCVLVLQPWGVTDDEAAASAAAPLDAASAEAGARFTHASAAPAREVRAILASADGASVATASAEMQLRVWQPGRGQAPSAEAQRSAGGGSAGGGLCLSLGMARRGGVWRTLPAANVPVLKEVEWSGGEAAEGLGGGGDCHAAVTSAVWSGAHAPGLLLAGSLDGIIHVWR